MTSSVRCAASVSEHPLPTHAVGECVGQLLDACGDGPDLLVLSVTAPLVGALEDVVSATHALLSPAVLVGGSAVAVLAGARHPEGVSALAMFGVWGLGHGPQAVRLAPSGVSSGSPERWLGAPEPDPPPGVATAVPDGAAGTLLLWGAGRRRAQSGPDVGVDDGVGDQTQADLLDWAAQHAPDLSIIGGVIDPGSPHGGARLILQEDQYVDGAVGVLFGEDTQVTAAVAQGFRPIGVPMTVTAAENRVIRELAGRPALDVIRETVAALDPADVHLASQGLYLGRVIDSALTSPRQQDHLVRPILGGDRSSGAVAVDDDVELGATVQLQLCDAGGALVDLVDTVGGALGDGVEAVMASGSYAFVSDTRDASFFAHGDDDASLLAELVEPGGLGGVSCSSQVAPIAGRNFAHRAAVAVALFG